jgi:hypothetical protein
VLGVPDIHATKAGYEAMAEAVLAVVPDAG